MKNLQLFSVLVLGGAVTTAVPDVFDFNQDNLGVTRTVGNVDLLIYSSPTGAVTVATTGGGNLVTGNWCDGEPMGTSQHITFYPGADGIDIHTFRNGEYGATITGFSSSYVAFTDATWENTVTFSFPSADYRDCSLFEQDDPYIKLCVKEGHELTGSIVKTPDNTLVNDPAKIFNMADWAASVPHVSPMDWDEESQCWTLTEEQLYSFGSAENPGLHFRSVYTYPKEMIADQYGRPKIYNNSHFVEVCMYLDDEPHPIYIPGNSSVVDEDWFDYRGDGTVFGSGDFRIWWEGISEWVDNSAPDYFRQCKDTLIDSSLTGRAEIVDVRRVLSYCSSTLGQQYFAFSDGECVRQPIDYTIDTIPSEDPNQPGVGPIYDVLIDIVIPPLYQKDSHVTPDYTPCEGFCFP